MFCPNCGGQVPEGMVCGCTQTAQPAQQQPAQQQPTPPPAQQYYQQNQPAGQQYQGYQGQPGQQPPPQMQYYPPPPPKQPADPKVACMKWSYVLIFWVIAFNKDYREDALVRFHAGQGIMLTLVTAALLIVRDVLLSFASYITTILTNIADYTSYSAINNGYLTVSLLLNAAVLAFYLVFMFIGIGNASKKLMTPLPIFGKAAFYK